MNQVVSQDWVPLWTALSANAAIATALVTAAYTYFTLRLVRSQGEPKVIMYVKHDLNRPSVLMIVVENIGRDIAHDVKFFPSKQIPAKAWGIELADAVQAATMNSGPLVSGIPALGPNDNRSISWGQYGGLSKAIGNEPIFVRYTYSQGKRTFSGETRLDVESYLGTDASETPAAAVAKGVKEIEKSMQSISESLKQFAKKTT